MKRRSFLFLLLLASCFAWIGCGNPSSAISGCRIDVSVDYPDFTSGLLKTSSGEILDSLTVTDGHFSLERKDSLMPYVALICLCNDKDSSDWMNMPVVIENGIVEVSLGNQIKTSGTLLNHALQEFLNALQATAENLRSRIPNVKPDDVNAVFSQLYKQQILENKNNVVGRYIFENYGNHLTNEDMELVKAALID